MLKDSGSFFVGGELEQADALSNNPNGPGGFGYSNTDAISVNQMYVQFEVPMGTAGNIPIIMIHGCCLTAKSWEDTPDGRMGWYEYFVRKHPQPSCHISAGPILTRALRLRRDLNQRSQAGAEAAEPDAEHLHLRAQLGLGPVPPRAELSESIGAPHPVQRELGKGTRRPTHHNAPWVRAELLWVNERLAGGILCISTNIDYVLRKLGVRSLIVAGVLTDQCVDSAVRDACDLVTVPTDACATLSQERHDWSLRNNRGYTRRVMTEAHVAEIERLTAGSLTLPA